MKLWERYSHFERRPPTEVERAFKSQYYFNEYSPGLPTELDLALISLREHLDVASQTLFQCLVKSDQYGPWIQRVHKVWSKESLPEPTRFQVFVAHSRLPVYESSSLNWSLPLLRDLEDLGVEVHEMTLDPRGSLSTNARILRATLESYMNRSSAIITLGRSTLEMARYLEALKGNFRELASLKAWVSLSGSYQGMELYRKKLKSPLRRWHLKGLSFLERQAPEALLELSTEYPVWGSEDFPEELPFEVVSMFGVPKTEGVHSSLVATHRSLADHGPNDGLNVLSQCLPPLKKGRVYPLWGDDFYLRSQGFRRSLRRILCGLLEAGS